MRHKAKLNKDRRHPLEFLPTDQAIKWVEQSAMDDATKAALTALILRWG